MPLDKNEGSVKGHSSVRCLSAVRFAREVEDQGSGNLTLRERLTFFVREQPQIPSRGRHTGDAFIENKGTSWVRSAKPVAERQFKTTF